MRWRGAVLGLLLAAGCGHSIVRLSKKGAHDEAIHEAESRRRPPKGRAARAFATSLVERGRTEQARGVLLTDYRHGGDLRSLVALADLERDLGLEGIAASHYGRAADLSRESLQGRQDVCALLRRRAQAWADEGAGLAAEHDLSRADRLCGAPGDAGDAARLEQLRAEVQAVAQQQVDGHVDRTRCGPDCDPTPDGSVEEAIERARGEGPAALRRVAADLRLQLSSDDIVTILSADLRAQAGEAPIDDDEVRQWVGEQSWSVLAPTVMSQPADLSSYLQLRLASVVDGVPVVLRSRTGPGELDVWLARSLETTGDQAWRLLAWAGDLSGAELALGTRWRPKRRPVASADEGAQPAEATSPLPDEPQAVSGVPPAEHWSSRVAPTAHSVPALLTSARMRHVTGHDRVALGIQRYVGARALQASVPRADEHIAREAAWHLAHGRPWQALAVASVSSRPHAQRVAAAAATALRLTEAFCGGACRNDRDHDLVERTLGEAWVRQQEEQLVERSRQRTRPRDKAESCPSLGELLAPDATGRLAEVLAEARRGEPSAGYGQRLREAIEGDLSLSCAGRYVLPLLHQGEFSAHAEGLAEILSHDAMLEAPRALTVHAALAMVAGQEQQASLLATAAGSVSAEPARTWRDLARHAHATGQRELALRSLREALMHTPRLHDPALHRAMVLAVLAGVGQDWNLRAAEAGEDEPAEHVRDLVERVEPARRFAAREELARALAQQPWFDTDAYQRLGPAMWPDEDVAAAHPVGRARLRLAIGEVPDLEPADVGPLDLSSQELLVTMGKHSALLPATVAFVEPPRMEALRLALARHSGQWVQRWRTAIGLATWGSPRARLEAMVVLLEMAEPEQRRALLDVILDMPTVVEPAPEGPAEAPLLATPEDELTVVFSLPVDPLGL